MDRKSAFVVTDVPPRQGFPNGYSDRYRYFWRALTDVFDVALLNVQSQPELGSAVFADPWLGGVQIRTEDVGPNPLNEPNGRGRLRRLLHYASPVSPAYMSHPRSGLATGSVAADVGVITLPHLAHLWSSFPAVKAWVFVLEEGWERAAEWAPRAGVGAKHLYVARVETARVRRVYGTLPSGSTVVAITEDEAERFRQLAPQTNVVCIPHSVDVDHFQSSSEQPRDIDIGVFGLMAGLNAQGARRVYEFRHSIERRLGRPTSWAFVGAGPASMITELARDEGVTVTGAVDDVRPFYDRTAVAVVPALTGAGSKTTLLQAWAMGVPVAASSFAALGVPAQDGDNLLIGDGPEGLADCVARLLPDDGLRQRIAVGGRQTVVASRDIVEAARTFRLVCEQAAGNGGR